MKRKEFINAVSLISSGISMPSLWVVFAFVLLFFADVHAQPMMKTGGQKMPDEWIDKSTGPQSGKVNASARKQYSNPTFILVPMENGSSSVPILKEKKIFMQLKSKDHR